MKKPLGYTLKDVDFYPKERDPEDGNKSTMKEGNKSTMKEPRLILQHAIEHLEGGGNMPKELVIEALKDLGNDIGMLRANMPEQHYSIITPSQRKPLEDRMNAGRLSKKERLHEARRALGRRLECHDYDQLINNEMRVNQLADKALIARGDCKHPINIGNEPFNDARMDKGKPNLLCATCGGMDCDC